MKQAHRTFSKPGPVFKIYIKYLYYWYCFCKVNGDTHKGSNCDLEVSLYSYGANFKGTNWHYQSHILTTHKHFSFFFSFLRELILIQGHQFNFFFVFSALPLKREIKNVQGVLKYLRANWYFDFFKLHLAAIFLSDTVWLNLVLYEFQSR